MSIDTQKSTIESKKEIPKAVMFVAAFVMGLTLNAAAIDTAVEYATQEIMWPNDEARITVLDVPYNESTSVMTVVFEGFGQKSAHDISEVLSPTLSKLGPVAYADYPDSGFGDDRGMLQVLGTEIKDTMHEYDKTELVVVARSIGGLILLNTLPYLNGVDIETVFLDCSPLVTSDAKEAMQAQIALWTKPFPHGFPHKIGIELYNSIFKYPDPNVPLYTKITESIRIAKSGVAPQLGIDQLEIMNSSKLDYLKQFILPNTKFVYLRPDNVDNDNTVYIEPAIKGWDKLVNGNMAVLDIPNGGHANPTVRPDEYNSVINAWLFPNELASKGITKISLTNIQKAPTDELGPVALEKPSN